MAIGVRDITNLEELMEVQDDDKIIVIQNGEAKLVSKANAKFGGGTVTVFYFDGMPSSSEPARLVDIDGNPISAKTAYDAYMSGLVYITQINPELRNEIGYMLPVNFRYFNTGVDITSTMFIDFIKHKYYAGTNPNEEGV